MKLLKISLLVISLLFVVPIVAPKISAQANAIYYYVSHYPFIYQYYWNGYSWTLINITYDTSLGI